MRLKDSFNFSIFIFSNTFFMVSALQPSVMPTNGSLRSNGGHDDSPSPPTQSDQSYDAGNELDPSLALALFGVAMVLVVCFLRLCFFKSNGIQRIPVVTASQPPGSGGEGLGAPLIRGGVWATTLPVAFNDASCSDQEGHADHSGDVPTAVMLEHPVRASLRR